MKNLDIFKRKNSGLKMASRNILQSLLNSENTSVRYRTMADLYGYAWILMKNKTNANGYVILDWTPAQCPVKFGIRGKPNEWLTFYYEMAKKYREIYGTN